ncbi:hypothetical protein ACODM8_12655 [Vibrio ostreicida]|uniref:hypothetical protein n=1 Tax=Vibrio ostreicida TaxID=526588 RepID=UPI003B58CAF4
MTDIHQAFSDINIDSLDVIHDKPQLWQHILNQNEDLYKKVKHSKPDKRPETILLGILTKAHIECVAQIEAHQSSVIAMRQALNDNLGHDHTQRFDYQDEHMLTLVTHLWLYLQGYLRMDFSLANDHAEHSARWLCHLGHLDDQSLRTQFLRSYYKGDENAPPITGSNPVFQWIKQRFKRK